MKNETILESILVLDGHNGIYIPKIFIETYNSNIIKLNVNDDDIKSLNNGPDDEFYWEAWENVLNNAIAIIGGEKYFLYADDDLFLIHEDYDFDM